MPTDWTLTAAGPTPDHRASPAAPRSPSAPVSAGTYTLSETGGPAGYTAGGVDLHRWHARPARSVVAAALGESATCTINNDDQPAT